MPVACYLKGYTSERLSVGGEFNSWPWCGQSKGVEGLPFLFG